MRLAYQPPTNNNFLSEESPVSSIFINKSTPAAE
jgi:hypothetical protein